MTGKDSQPLANDIIIWLAATSDQERRQLVDALSYNGLAHRLQAFDSGASLLARLDDLAHRSVVSRRAYPALLLLALEDGPTEALEVLARVKRNEVLKSVPAIVFKGQDSHYSTLECYRLGAASVIRLPLRFEGLVEVMRIMENYWFSVSPLPGLPPKS